MSAVRLSNRYAKSLIGLAIEQQKLEQVLDDISMLREMIESNRDFYLMLKSPVIQTDKKQKILDIILRGRVEDITLHFIQIMTAKKRELYLPEIVDAFIEQYKEHKNITTVEVTTAVELSDEAMEQFRRKVKELTGMEKVEMVTKVDENILGGFILHYEGLLYDASIAHQLNELKKEFTSNKYVKTI